MDDISIKRLQILNYSLKLEKITSYFLGVVFDIKDFQNTKSFGNQSSSLSFNQKMNLLLDYKVIDKDDKIKVDAIMNVRNQFLHNEDCKSYKDAFNAIDGLENKLKKIYSEIFEIEENERALEFSIECAYDDCVEIFYNAKSKGGLSNKFLREAELATYKEIVETISENASLKFAEFEKEIVGDNFDYKDKLILLDRVKKLITDVFDLSEISNPSEKKFFHDILL